MSQQTTRPTITEQIAVARPPHRLERLSDWMQEHELDAVVVAGPDEAYPAPPPLAHYPFCKPGQFDKCMERNSPK